MTDEQLAAAAQKGFDDYWTEDCAGSDAEAWAASAKAVLAIATPKDKPVAWIQHFANGPDTLRWSKPDCPGTPLYNAPCQARLEALACKYAACDEYGQVIFPGQNWERFMAEAAAPQLADDQTHE